jgi:GNAT superfamily N-acetyltransferase
MTEVSLICTPQSFRPSNCVRVRWLDWDHDYPAALANWPKEYPLTLDDWQKNRADGFRYCAVVEHAAIVALAAVWTYSETHWEVAAVSTAPAARRHGYGTAVAGFA